MVELLTRDALAERLTRACAGARRRTPLAVVDLDAFAANAADLATRAGGKPIRVASKSLRVPWLIESALAHRGFAGVLAYSLPEALWLHDQAICNDIVVAYPCVDRTALAQLAASEAALGAVTLIIDDLAHLRLLEQTKPSTPVQVAIDLDAGLRVANQHVGPKRSPIYDPTQLRDLASAVAVSKAVTLVGAMAYEGQVAGVPDQVPGQRLKSVALKRMKSMSLAQLAIRRAEAAGVLADFAPVRFFNGGGSGSLAESAADPSVTELSAGSGLLVPGLFDHYANFEPRPAAFFAVPVTRKPSPELATVHGGGFVASGAAGPDRLPQPYAPSGLHTTSLEGVGEVQTPLTGPGAAGLQIGDWVWFRHAKSGELFEHVNEVSLVSGDQIVESVPTYRGLGHVW